MRLTQIDTAKFLAVFFVIISHCCMHNILGEFLFSFHVQLFFIAFGYVFKQKYENVKDIKWGRQINRLIIPYILLALILGQPLSLHYVIQIFYGNTVNIGGVEHLWFLPCFFMSMVLFTYLYMFFAKKHWLYLCITVMMFGVVSSILDYDHNICFSMGNKIFHLTGSGMNSKSDYYIGFPFVFNAALTGVVLMYIGNILRKIFDYFNVLKCKLKAVSLCLLAFGIGVITFAINQKNLDNGFDCHLVTPSFAIYGNYLLFILTSTLLSIATICLSVLLDCKLTSKLGKETMVIYAFHPFFIGVFGFYGLSIFHGLISSVLVLFITCLMIPALKKYAPNVIGEICK